MSGVENWRQSKGPTAASSTYLAHEHFSRSTQLKRMLFRSMLRWLLTAASAASIYLLLCSYSEREALPSTKKEEFNTLIIGLSIALGLNIASSLKAHVSDLRWWLLSLHTYTPREADLILQSENLSRLLQLGWTSRRWTIRLFVLIFITLNVISQVATALLGLTFNLESVSNLAVTEPGVVRISDMSDVPIQSMFGKELTEAQALNARRHIANSLGLLTLAEAVAPTDEIPRPGTILTPGHPMLFFDLHTAAWHYVFLDSTPETADPQIHIFTNRSIFTQAECNSWPITQGGEGYSNTFTMRYKNDTTQILQLPVPYGPDQTTFLHDPTSESKDSSAIVRAFEASRTEPWLYSCNVSISPVKNSIIKEHLLGVNLTQLVAPAIALQGYGASSADHTNATTQHQFQSYPAGSIYGTPCNGDTKAMALRMARFAIGCILATADQGKAIHVAGMTPLESITLEVNHWDYVHLILGLTVSTQLFVATASVLIACRVQVRCHSYFSIAALVRPALQEVNRLSRAADGTQVVAMLGDEVTLTYAPEPDGGYYIRQIGSKSAVFAPWDVSGYSRSNGGNTKREERS